MSEAVLNKLTVLGLAWLATGVPPAAGQTSVRPLAIPALSRPHTVRLSRNDNGRTLHLRVGDTLELRLPGNPSTGFSWVPTAPVGPVVGPLGAPVFHPSSGGLGANGLVLQRYRALMPGSCSLSLTYRRTFESPSHPPTFTVFLHVR